jgi:methyl-accepting chemotaxis protein
MNMNNLKIGRRLGVGFGAVLVLMVAIVAFSYSRLTTTASAMAQIDSAQQRSKQVDEWVRRTQLNVTRVIAVAKARGAPEVEGHFGPLIKQTTAEISTIQKGLESSIDSDEGKAMLADIAAKRQTYVSIRADMVDRRKQGDAAGADTMLNDKMLPAAEAYLASMVALQASEAKFAADEAARVHAAIELAGNLLIGLLIAGLAVGTGMAVLITRSVTSPLAEAVHAAELIAGSDLSQELKSRRLDELGDLLRAIGRMQAALRQLVGQVRASTDSISTASTEIASGNQDLSTRTEQTASNLQEAASAMEQITGTIAQSADSARQANRLAASAAEVAGRGGVAMAQVVDTMDGINASSKQISEIVGVIDGIAFQTNILALNAAVEAARAGEQGRGFAVVASEVRSLAQRSAQAAKEIKVLIGNSVERVEGGSRQVADAGQTMQEIVNSVRRLSDIIGEISTAADEQSKGIGQMNDTVTQLDQMTQQNAALVEEGAAAAISMKDQTNRLASLVATFNLGATRGSTT